MPRSGRSPQQVSNELRAQEQGSSAVSQAHSKLLQEQRIANQQSVQEFQGMGQAFLKGKQYEDQQAQQSFQNERTLDKERQSQERLNMQGAQAGLTPDDTELQARRERLKKEMGGPVELQGSQAARQFKASEEPSFKEGTNRIRAEAERTKAIGYKIQAEAAAAKAITQAQVQRDPIKLLDEARKHPATKEWKVDNKLLEKISNGTATEGDVKQFQFENSDNPAIMQDIQSGEVGPGTIDRIRYAEAKSSLNMIIGTKGNIPPELAGKVDWTHPLMQQVHQHMVGLANKMKTNPQLAQMVVMKTAEEKAAWMMSYSARMVKGGIPPDIDFGASQAPAAPATTAEPEVQGPERYSPSEGIPTDESGAVIGKQYDERGGLRQHQLQPGEAESFQSGTHPAQSNVSGRKRKNIQSGNTKSFPDRY